MSRFFSETYRTLVPYVPGEQPRDMQYVKLNTNESPFPPSPLAQRYAGEAAQNLHLYSDPQLRDLTEEAAKNFGVSPDEILFSNGSDEILHFAFMAFCDKDHPAVFPDITYGFYAVFTALCGVPHEEIPLKEDFSVCAEDYIGLNKTVFLANPNAPTGLALPLTQIEAIVKGNPNSVVVIDEAYVDFGAQSTVGLIHKYENLLVTQTFSKSRSMAGARLGFAIGCKELIRDLNTIKYSTNPYNVNRMTAAAGVGALRDREYFETNCKKIAENRRFVTRMLRDLGFTVLDSSANFVFAKHPAIGGKELYAALKRRGILVRHFDGPRLTDYNRITVGSSEQLQALLAAIREILEEKP